MEKIMKKVILFLTGFCVYITIEVLFRGYSYPLMGVGAGLLLTYICDNINNKISWDMDLLLQGFIGSFFVTIFELVVGGLLKYTGQSPMWDYSNIPLNFDGVICLPFSLLWVLLSIVGIWVADAINYYVFEELPVPYYKIFGKVRIRFREKHCKLNNNK